MTLFRPLIDPIWTHLDPIWDLIWDPILGSSLGTQSSPLMLKGEGFRVPNEGPNGSKRGSKRGQKGPKKGVLGVVIGNYARESKVAKVTFSFLRARVSIYKQTPNLGDPGIWAP